MNKGQHASLETRALMSASASNRSPESRARASAQMMGHATWTGKHHTIESRDKMSVAKMGHETSIATRERMSVSHKGIPVSAETRARLSLAVWRGGKKETGRRSHAKRRGLGYVYLNSPFPGSEGHHINRIYVIHVPKALNQGISHDVWTGRGMEKINALAIQWLTGDGFSC